MTEETARILVSKYFEENNLEFLSMITANENGERISVIEFSCNQGVFYMKLFKDLSLFCQNKARNGWVQIQY